MSIEKCVKCGGAGFVLDPDWDHTPLASTCPVCIGSGEVEQCQSCADLFPHAEEDGLYLNDDNECVQCAQGWTPRKAIVWESDIDGMYLHYYLEIKPDVWVSRCYQSERSGEVKYESDPMQFNHSTTNGLGFCSDGGVVIDGDKFIGLDEV